MVEPIPRLEPGQQIAEDTFITTFLNPKFEVMKSTLPAGTAFLTKIQVLSLLELATGREKKKDGAGVESGGIKEEQFVPFLNQVAPMEPGADKYSFADAFDVILLFCIDEKIIPTRLQTALTAYVDE